MALHFEEKSYLLKYFASLATHPPCQPWNVLNYTQPITRAWRATEGVYIFNTNRRGGRMTFPELDSPLRTDASFRNQIQPQHHNGKSILVTLPISMAYNFVIDVMHLVFIGVMRKLLHVWLNCRRAIKVHLLKATITAVSNNLDQIKNCIPSDFARKTRNLSELPRYPFI